MLAAPGAQHIGRQRELCEGLARLLHYAAAPRVVDKARIGCHDEGVVTCVALTP